MLLQRFLFQNSLTFAFLHRSFLVGAAGLELVNSSSLLFDSCLDDSETLLKKLLRLFDAQLEEFSGGEGIVALHSLNFFNRKGENFSV